MDEITKNIPQEPVEDNDDLFPEFLWNPLFNEFDEDDGFYQEIGDEYPYIDDVLRLKRKYRDFYKWQEAMRIYNDYMYFLETKYGSMAIIKNSIEDGIPLDDFIPSVPKLKRNPTNKQIMKTGAIPTKRTVKAIDPDDIKDIVDSIYGDMVNTTSCDFDSDSNKKSKEAIRDQEIFDEIMGVNAMRDRVENVKMKRSARRTNGNDIIDDFYNSVNRINYDSYGRRRKEDECSITELVEHMDDEKYIDPAILAYEHDILTQPTAIVRGVTVKKERQNQLDIMKYLLQSGYRIDAIAGASGRDKQAVKMLKMQLGITDAPTTEDMQRMTKKERKKHLKKLKKQSKQARINDNHIDEILFANRINRGDGSLAYRMNNLMSTNYEDD